MDSSVASDSSLGSGCQDGRRAGGQSSQSERAAETSGPTGASKSKRTIEELRTAGQRLRSDADQPKLAQKPHWFDEELFAQAKSVYARHFMAINFAHLSGLLLLVRINSIYRTLSVTGKSDSVAKLFGRYYQTLVHVKRWYEGDIFQEDSAAQRSLLLVRAMHNKVSANLNGSSKDEEGRVHISEFDIMLTQFAFIGFIVTRAKQVGLLADFSERDLRSLLHFWRVIGHYLGASERFNLCAREPAEVLAECEAILTVEFRSSIRDNPLASAPGVMGANIVRSLKFIPMLTIYGITRYLYELIGVDGAELEERATRYSRLSYTLIKLVMSRLLAYRALRAFNNGLTRLSVFLVGKMEATFAGHLDKKYGAELKL